VSAGLVLSAGADAKTFVVTDKSDAGRGSLRQAVERANDHRGRDRITFARKLHGPIRLADRIESHDPLTIVGRGVNRGPYLKGKVRRYPEDRFTQLRASNTKHSAPLTIRRLKLDTVGIFAREPVHLSAARIVTETDKNDVGPAVQVEREPGSTMRDVRINGWTWGATVLTADIEISDSTITDSSEGGLAFNLSDATLSGSTVSDNGGGGIYVHYGDEVSISDSTVAGNEGFGGIDANYESSIELARSTVSGNQAEVGGGLHLSEESTARIRNSTISGNSAIGSEKRVGRGGGIWASQRRSFSLEASTVTGNAAQEGGGIFLGERTFTDDPVTIAGSIVAGNSAPVSPDCLTEEPSEPVSGGGNVFGPEGCGTAGPGDVLTAQPGLGPLADNGGPTMTHAVLSDSPAIDNGPDLGLKTDQRGVRRGPHPDSGSFERRP
jgi:parallel beta-helix repeat protein